MVEAAVLAAKKQNDYGPENIRITGLPGLSTRIMDKASRLVNLTINKKGAEVDDERVFDTLMDIANYGTIGMLLEKGKWGLW